MRIVPDLLIIILFITYSCEGYNSGTDPDITDGFSIKIGEDFVLGPEEIDYYDFSSHFIYLKNGYTNPAESEQGDTFSIFAMGEEIYNGLIVPIFSCYLPSGVVIHTPSYYPDFIIAIDFVQLLDSTGNPVLSDPREDDRIIMALKKYGQFHEGLSGEIESIQFSDDHTVTINLELQNNDTWDYYFLDPGKMGFPLFHYFTNGLYLINADRTVSYEVEAESEQPDPWNTWNTEWLTLIRSKETVYLSITYDNFTQVPPGSYIATFIYPGLSYQVSKEDITLDNGRIWLGKINMNKEITLE